MTEFLMVRHTTHDQEPLQYGEIRRVRYDGKRMEVVD